MQPTKGLMVSKKAKWLAIAVLSCSSLSQAALPPQHQNSDDLNTMLRYIQGNPAVMSGLQAIDLVSHTVFYGEGCTAVFERLVIEKPEGWTGPADPLVIKQDSCPNYDDMDDAGFHEMGDIDDITLRATDGCSIEVEEESCKP
ncbi:hypothetical protein [Leucothrix arctica]|uniref:Uncharacterized protein n=1 Tax=Leucothrix arctica TaxID=1481894 RepID=A0A317CLT8_9GAMM|nr:hypothetical protein [Leucothrix arctica]PWQ97260.1 hypothetical protein DKT75_06895 [Leucothrix arctica]